MSFVSIVKLLFWLLLVPLCTGLIPYRFLPLHKRGLSLVMIAGYLLLFGLFEVIAIPCMLAIVYDSFYTCARIYTVAALVAACVGILSGGKEFIRREKKAFTVRSVREKDKEEMIYWGIFLVLVCFELYMAATHMFFDGDDAYYVTESLLAQEAGVMNTILPYTGMSTTLDVRHALSVITMWIAFIAHKSGVHAAITAHTVMPFVFLPLTYLVYYHIAKLLFTNRAVAVNSVNTTRSKKEPNHMHLRPVFLIFISLFFLFGNVSIYTPETFLMMRTWQGKSLIANFALPMMFFLLLWIATDAWKAEGGLKKSEELMPWCFLFFTNMAAGICSSMGIVLAAVFFGVSIAAVAIAKKKFLLLIYTAVSFLPSLIYILLYLLL